MNQLVMHRCFLTICILIGVVDASRPRLNVTSGVVVDIRDEHTFAIRCEGTSPLSWNASNMFSNEYEITNHEHHNTDFPYVSILKTTDELNIVFTGRFYCSYVAGDWNVISDQVASAYVYFFDGESGLVDLIPSPQPLHVTTNDKLVLPCRTTHPDTTVTLTKDGVEVKIGDRVTFDPTLGFIVENLRLTDSGYYMCTTQFNIDLQQYSVTIMSGSLQMNQPAMELITPHLVLGDGFMINCTLVFDGNMAFHWYFPASDLNHTITTSTQTVASNQAGQGTLYQISTLYVHKATDRHSGEYTCEVSAPARLPNEVTNTFEVKESIEPFISLSGVRKVSYDEGSPERFKIRTEVRAYPPNPQIIYRDWRGRELVESDRITTEHYVNEETSWLEIEDADWRDFGNYSIEAISQDAKIRDKMYFQVNINSAPRVWLSGVAAIVEPGQEWRPHCNVTGYPNFPNMTVTWAFKGCLENQQDCGNPFITIEPDAGDEPVVLPPGNILRQSITFSTSTSGMLRCTATNSRGSSSHTQDVVVSDIGGSFVFRHTGRNLDTYFEEGSSSLKVVENDDFNIMCGGVTFYYDNVMLNASNDVKIQVNNSKYSVAKYINESKVTKQLAGMYSCTVKNQTSGRYSTKNVTVQVLAEQRVTFTEDANIARNDEATVLLGDVFTINCTVEGTPPPEVIWFKDGVLLTPDSELFEHDVWLVSDGQGIELEGFRRDHVGVYECQAENRLGAIRGSITLATPRERLSASTYVALTFTCIGILFLMVVVFVLLRRVKREKRLRKSISLNKKFLFEKGNIDQLNPDCCADEQAELLPYSEEWEVKREDIVLGRQLGSGAFGRVVKAKVTGLCEEEHSTVVAIKMCKSQTDQAQIHALICELKIMLHLGKHLNIVNLMGANTVHIDKGELWILVEFCRYGNLLSFMHKHRKHFVNQIDAATDKIDPTKTVPDNTPMSPGVDHIRAGYRSAPTTSDDGYLPPKSASFKLPSAPRTHPSLSHSMSSGSQSSEPMHVDNLVYGMPVGGGGQSVGGGASHPPGLARTMSSTSGKKSSVSFTPRPETSQTSPFFLDAPTPLSPTDSNRTSDMGVDSQGNPFPFEVNHTPGVNAPFTTSDLICWSWQVAQGMDYLSSRKVLHGDLAARNLLLADNNVIKISDFGLSRDIYKKDIYMKKGDDLMPIKWMSVEAIRDRIFSVQSDIWAFGVTMWELFTLGSTPYPGIEVNQDFLALLEKGHRMARPKFANQELYGLINACWSDEPEDRPSFHALAETMGAMMLPDIRGEYMTMNDPYLRLNEERFRHQTDYLNMLSSPDYCNQNKKEPAHDYVNLQHQDSSNGRESNYLSMDSEAVRYSKGEVTPGGPTMSYLPMGSVQDSPMVDVFSPRPADELRFSFNNPNASDPLLTREANGEAPGKWECEDGALMSATSHPSADSHANPLYININTYGVDSQDV